MTRVTLAFCFVCVGLAACQSIEEAQETDAALNAPVNCATAEGDLRVLRGEQAHVADQLAAGETTISPSSLYGYNEDFLTPSPDSEVAMQTEIGRFQQAVDAKIAEIETTCGL